MPYFNTKENTKENRLIELYLMEGKERREREKERGGERRVAKLPYQI